MGRIFFGCLWFVAPILSSSISYATPGMVCSSTVQFNGPEPHRIDSRPSVNALQNLLVNARGGIAQILRIAEGSYPDYIQDDFQQVADQYGGFVTVTDPDPNENGRLILTFSGASHQLNIGDFSLTYTPTITGNGAIEGWDCESTAQDANLGEDFIKIDSGSDPILVNLGWPYEACTVPS